MTMSDSFDANEMFCNDEQFKTDLTPLDLEGLQMLEDPSNVLTDPGTEEQLRLWLRWAYRGAGTAVPSNSVRLVASAVLSNGNDNV